MKAKTFNDFASPLYLFSTMKNIMSVIRLFSVPNKCEDNIMQICLHSTTDKGIHKQNVRVIKIYITYTDRMSVYDFPTRPLFLCVCQDEQGKMAPP